MFWDPTMIILIPALLLAGWAQLRVQTTFQRFSKVGSARRISGADLASTLMRHGGLDGIKIEPVAGSLTDHYDPGKRILRLSEPVYGNSSIAALGVAAHEVGHAFQHENGYIPLKIRNSLVPAANFSSTASFPLILLGLLLGIPGLATLGVLIFTAVVLFQLVTLPVEFNASHRAVALLSSGGYITSEEVPMVRRVLGAAALTYVAAALVSFFNLLRFLFILGVFNDN